MSFSGINYEMDFSKKHCLCCKKEFKNRSSMTKHRCTPVRNVMWAEMKLLCEAIKNGDDTKETKDKYERLALKHRLLTDYIDIMCAVGRPTKKAYAMMSYNVWNFCKCNTPNSQPVRAVHLWDWFYITPCTEYEETFDIVLQEFIDRDR